MTIESCALIWVLLQVLLDVHLFTVCSSVAPNGAFVSVRKRFEILATVLKGKTLAMSRQVSDPCNLGHGVSRNQS